MLHIFLGIQKHITHQIAGTAKEAWDMLCFFFWSHREGGVKWSSVQATERLLHWNMWQQTSMNILLVPKEPKENEPWCFQSSARIATPLCLSISWPLGLLVAFSLFRCLCAGLILLLLPKGGGLFSLFISSSAHLHLTWVAMLTMVPLIQTWKALNAIHPKITLVLLDQLNI